MATTIRHIMARDFLEVTADGIINMDTSRQLIVDIAKAEHHHADYELLIDLRDTQSELTVTNVYQLAAELCKHGTTFRRKVALVVTPGINFNQADFFETCAHNRGFFVNAYTDYETALRWILEVDE